uniref:Uncharacterized protein n=1 Tax=Tanacetum cinerariifolium TaxID=118510 RepID=A0A699H918_TANCI|nr:hypothetical protein [Tanacetum cinerariifolium]
MAMVVVRGGGMVVREGVWIIRLSLGSKCGALTNKCGALGELMREARRTWAKCGGFWLQRLRTEVASCNQSMSHSAHQAGQWAVRRCGGVNQEVSNTCVTPVVNHAAGTNDDGCSSVQIEGIQLRRSYYPPLDKKDEELKKEDNAQR